MNMDELFQGREALTADQWRDCLIRSVGMEPATLGVDVQWHIVV